MVCFSRKADNQSAQINKDQMCNKTVVTLLIIIHEMVKNMINKNVFPTLHKFTIDMFSHKKKTVLA